MTAPAPPAPTEGVEPDDDQPVQSAPDDLKASGRKLWESLAEDFDFDEHELVLLHQACRITDHLDSIAAEVEIVGVTSTNGRGDPVASPAYVEHRQQSLALGRLLAALRIPAGEETDRPQRRGGFRGTYAGGVRGHR